MWAVNVVYERDETSRLVRRRWTANASDAYAAPLTLGAAARDYRT